MGRRRRVGDSPSSSIDSSSATHPILSSKTDLTLGLTLSTCSRQMDWPRVAGDEDIEVEGHPASLFVKVYMEGVPIGRKLDLMALHGYDDLIRTLHFMFNTTILWAEKDGEESDWEKCPNVLTYQDQEGDWLMVGDVPWEMFLSAVKRLKITQIDR